MPSLCIGESSVVAHIEEHWNSAFNPLPPAPCSQPPADVFPLLGGVFSSYKLAARLLPRKKETDFHVSVKELEDEGR
jgi:hypothetical protein